MKKTINFSFQFMMKKAKPLEEVFIVNSLRGKF